MIRSFLSHQVVGSIKRASGLTKGDEKRVEAMFSHNYICPKCGAKMEFEDKCEDILICTNCRHDMELDRYGFENDEEYEALYPTKEEVLCREQEEKK